MTTKLQGAFRAPADATIRLTENAGATDSDWAVSAGDVWESVDALIAEWNAQLESDFGAGVVVLSITESASAYTGTVTVATTGATVDVTWSQAGDGSAIRDFLGESGDLASKANGYTFTSRHKCGWYAADPEAGAQMGTRQSIRRRPRGRKPLLSGSSQTQHNTSPSDVDAGPFELLLRITDGSGANEGCSMLETFVDELHDTTGALPRFTVSWDDGTKTQRARLATTRLNFMPVAGSTPHSLWDCSVRCEVAG